MSNSLTGDFEAVLQVGGRTVNRLLASMHQNGFTNPNTPSFPHSVQLRIGDDYAIDNVHGYVKAQVASPLVELIDGVTDRFWLQVGVRARFYPDTGSNPLPAFINGTVRAQYRIEPIDPNCTGWAQLANEYVWVRVVKDTVSFYGTTGEDQRPSEVPYLSGSVEDHGAIEARITRQIAALLATRFEATPQRVSKRFRRGSMRSLVPPIGDPAVVAPLGVSGDPIGDITSVGQVFLNSADFAIAVSRDAVLGLAQPALEQIQAFKATVQVNIDSPWYSPLPDVSTVYHVTTNPPVVEWHAYGSFAAIKIKVHGNATTNSILPNASFDIDQDITLNFDGGAESLWLGVGSRTVKAHVNGPLGGLAADQVKNGIESRVKPIIDAAVAAAQPGVNATIGRKQELITQLRGLDAVANARFTDAAFEHEGAILRGRISLSPRAVPEVAFEKTVEQDGFTAVKSWIPGGRIDKFDWTWGWFTGGHPGSSSYDDRFVLRRPGGAAGKWGQLTSLSMPLPGLDGSGKVCLRIRGVQMDPVTGELRTVSATFCHRFGFNIYVKVRDVLGTVLVPDLPELSQDVPFPQLTLVDLASSHPGSNTLVVYAGREANRETADALREGLALARRTDAGLTLLVIVPEGQLAGGHAEHEELVAEVRRLSERLGLATVFAEDVGNRWASALNVGGGQQTAWQLTDPHGDARWTWSGRVAGDALAKALDHNLVTSVNPKSEILGTAMEIGKRIGIELVRPDVIGRHCPPFPLARAGAGGTVVTFVQANSAASEAHLRDLSRRQQQSGGTPPDIVVIVGGTEQGDAESYVAQFGRGFVALADPRRSVTTSFGVRVWPTTFSLDRVGKVEAVEAGVSGRRRRSAADSRDDVTAP